MAKSATTGASLPFDPSANVIRLVELGAQRQDDLRAAADRRQDDLRDLTTTWRDKFAALQVTHQHELAANEQGRIDALLEANTNNVALALSKQGDQALAQDKRIATLEQNQYSGAGGTAAVDKAQAKTTISQGQLLTAGVLLIAALTYLHSIHVI
jgi:hypothetical protein